MACADGESGTHVACHEAADEKGAYQKGLLKGIKRPPCQTPPPFSHLVTPFAQQQQAYLYNASHATFGSHDAFLDPPSQSWQASGRETAMEL